MIPDVLSGRIVQFHMLCSFLKAVNVFEPERCLLINYFSCWYNLNISGRLVSWSVNPKDAVPLYVWSLLLTIMLCKIQHALTIEFISSLYQSLEGWYGNLKRWKRTPKTSFDCLTCPLLVWRIQLLLLHDWLTYWCHKDSILRVNPICKVIIPIQLHTRYLCLETRSGLIGGHAPVLIELNNGLLCITLISFLEPGLPNITCQIYKWSSHITSIRRTGFLSFPL